MELQQFINPKEKLQDENPYTVQKLSFQIDSANQNFTAKNTTLSISSQYFQLIIGESIQDSASLKIVYVSLSNVSSIGISGQKLCVFLQSQNQDKDQICEEVLAQGSINEQKQEIKNQSVITLLKESKAGNFNITGNLTINIGFQNYNKAVLKQVHDILVQKLQSIQQSEEGQNEMMGEMINADSINEDGTINFDKLNNHQQIEQNIQGSQSQEDQQQQQKHQKK